MCVVKMATVANLQPNIDKFEGKKDFGFFIDSYF